MICNYFKKDWIPAFAGMTIACLCVMLFLKGVLSDLLTAFKKILSEISDMLKINIYISYCLLRGFIKRPNNLKDICQSPFVID